MVPGAADEVDLGLCVTVGQVFRWRTIDNDRWRGFDGEACHEVHIQGADWHVRTTAPEADFRRTFRLDEDLKRERRCVLEIDPDFEEIFAGTAGLRIMRPSSPVETFFSFLCTSNNHILRISQMVENLARLGPPTSHGHAFPCIEAIAATPESVLRDLGFGYRAPTIIATANRLVEFGGEAWLSEMSRGPYQEAFHQLVKFPGIGPKLADCICLFALGHGEAVPVDTHLWQAVVSRYYPEWTRVALTPRRGQQIGDDLRAKFGDLAGMVHHHLFVHHLQQSRRAKPQSEHAPGR